MIGDEMGPGLMGSAIADGTMGPSDSRPGLRRVGKNRTRPETVLLGFF
jgi:hypothetical protein